MRKKDPRRLLKTVLKLAEGDRIDYKLLFAKLPELYMEKNWPSDVYVPETTGVIPNFSFRDYNSTNVDAHQEPEFVYMPMAGYSK